MAGAAILLLDWFVDTDRRRADRRDGAGSCRRRILQIPGHSSISACWAPHSRCSGLAAVPWMRVCSDASRSRFPNSHATYRERHSPRKGCGSASRSRCLAGAPSRVVDDRLPLQTARQEERRSDATVGTNRHRTDTHDDGLSAFHERASSSLRHRVPDARQRSRGRGHRAGRLGTLADCGSQPGPRYRRVPRDDSDTTGDQRHAVGTLAPGDVRWILAAGTRRHERRPGSGAERGEALASGVLLLLEKLSPTERAAYIPREAFDYAYRDIANVLRLEEANARQVVTRARQHIVNGRSTAPDSTEPSRLLEAFVRAAQHGDIVGLERVLASSVVRASDDGGWVRAA